MILASIFPAQLTALRATGLAIAILIIAFALIRRRHLRNADVILLLLAGFGLAIVSGTELTDRLLSALSFNRGNGGRILGLAVIAIFILFLMALRALSVGARNARQLQAVLEGISSEQFREAGHRKEFKGRIGVVIPAYNEADNIGYVLDQIPAEVGGLPTATLVVDDGSKDGTEEVAEAHGAVVIRHVVNRGVAPPCARATG